MHLARRTAQDVAGRSTGAARAHHEHAWLPSLQVQRAHRFFHPSHSSQVCRLVHGEKGHTGTKAWLAEFLTPVFTSAVCKLYDVLRLTRMSGDYPCDDQVRPLARADRIESVPTHSIERPSDRSPIDRALAPYAASAHVLLSLLRFSARCALAEPHVPPGHDDHVHAGQHRPDHRGGRQAGR
jgi:hypothetical protein